MQSLPGFCSSRRWLEAEVAVLREPRGPCPEQELLRRGWVAPTPSRPGLTLLKGPSSLQPDGGEGLGGGSRENQDLKGLE